MTTEVTDVLVTALSSTLNLALPDSNSDNSSEAQPTQSQPQVSAEVGLVVMDQLSSFTEVMTSKDAGAYEDPDQAAVSLLL